MFLMSVIAVAPIVFISGVAFGEWHVKKLAKNGGEERYPQFVQDAVESYREQNEYILQEYPWDDD